MKSTLTRSARLLGMAIVVTALVAPAAHAGKLVWEAENYTSIVAPFKVVANTKCSGGKYVFYADADPETASACVNYKINVPTAGKYTFWARSWWMDGCGNSFWLKVDGDDKHNVEGPTYQKWLWVRLKSPVLELSAGEHVIQIVYRETGIGIDQLLLVEGNYVPVNKLTPTPNLVVH